MVKRILLSLVVAVATALCVHLLGLALSDLLDLQKLGDFLIAIDGLVGLLAGVWFFLTHPTGTRVI